MASNLTKDDTKVIQQIVDKSVNKAVEDLSAIIQDLAQTMAREIVEIKMELAAMNRTLDMSIARLNKHEDIFVNHEKRLTNLELS